jgi:hypothetical protein
MNMIIYSEEFNGFMHGIFCLFGEDDPIKLYFGPSKLFSIAMQK